MIILPILTIPNALLKEISTPVEKVDKEIGLIVDNIKKTLYYHERCVGIAAVQVGILKRIIVVDASRSAKEHRNNGLLIMINPKVVYSSGKISSREGCLSVPEFTGYVTRKKKIEVDYFDINGCKRYLKTDGFESIVLQHEIDHLDGKIFLDRVSSLKTDIFRR
ncbi:MAG: peptide deformylase [Endomicrobium sp.]|jgi:peptide deformylase|nr:peptide deformylase [Endomicrobium sp.]